MKRLRVTPAIIVADISILIKLIRANRIDIIEQHSHDFIITEHVEHEFLTHYSDLLEHFSNILQNDVIRIVSVDEGSASFDVFQKLISMGRLGPGESAAIALASEKSHILAIDDRRAAYEARKENAQLKIWGTKDLIISARNENLINEQQADALQNRLESFSFNSQAYSDRYHRP